MRGEESLPPLGGLAWWELPPHARRRGGQDWPILAEQGITSACAEKRPIDLLENRVVRNYLRMRGEELAIPYLRWHPRELPPHARRRVPRAPHLGGMRGITSACAEKSLNARIMHTSFWNYLRMRGEERRIFASSPTRMELPPHARRRGHFRRRPARVPGITSACAEKRHAL